MAIIITESRDITTNKVMDWCLANNTKIHRINSQAFSKMSFEINDEDDSTIINQQKISPKRKYGIDAER